MLLTPDAQPLRRSIESRMNPGYRDSEPARLLADSFALMLAMAKVSDSREITRDCLDSAIRIERYLLDTLSELRVSREDVEGQFDQLRTERVDWPESISEESWERLASSRLLRDISDVICGGGDYWEAIRVALDSEFDQPTRPIQRFRPRTLYYAFDEDDWRDLHNLAGDLETTQAHALRTLISRVEDRTAERFAMVVWSLQDILDAVARQRGFDTGPVSEATWEQANVDREWVENVILLAESSMCDRMVELGWEVLEDAISEIGIPGN